MSTSSSTRTYTYTSEDVTKVVRRFTADLKMIASSTKAMTEEEAAKYGYDVDYLAQYGFLEMVDVTLLDAGLEVTAVQYQVRSDGQDLTPSRPGGVLWPSVANPFLRIVLKYTDAYTAAEREKHRPKLKISWSPTDASLTHSSLRASGGRDYSSNGFGVSRKDFT